MKKFYLQRTEDESGVSGTGKVAEGIIFGNEKVAMSWIQENTEVEASSIAVYDSIQDVKKIHGHNGKTEVVVVYEKVDAVNEEKI